MDHRSLNTEITTLYGRATAIKVHQFEQSRVRVSKLKTDLAFLKRCRDSSLVPLFAQIKRPLNNSSGCRIFLNASMALVRLEIGRVRKVLDFISRNLLSLHLELSNEIFAPLWSRIEACSALKSSRLEEIWKVKQSKKFSKLSEKFISHPNESSCFRGPSRSLINSNQISALRSWVDVVSHPSAIKGEARTISYSPSQIPSGLLSVNSSLVSIIVEVILLIIIFN